MCRVMDMQRSLRDCFPHASPRSSHACRGEACAIRYGFYYINGAPDRIRTYGLCLRRAALYPAELRVLGQGALDTRSTAPGQSQGACAAGPLDVCPKLLVWMSLQ